jgi:PAS domain S-box-containing protein/putative nucleotidyltransferase with HDIG domain
MKKSSKEKLKASGASIVEELKKIIDSKEIQSLWDSFYALTNMGGAIVDLNGNILAGTGWQDICAKFHRVNKDSSKNCIESDLYLTQNIKPGEYSIYKCKNNMWDVATPIIVDGKHMGNLFFGQFFFEDEIPDYEVFIAQAEKFGFNKEEYLAALKLVPQWSRDKIKALMNFYSKFAQMISTLSFKNLKLAKALSDNKLTGEALRESEERFRSFVENANDIVYSLTLDGILTYVSPHWTEVLGHDLHEVVGQSFEAFVHPDDVPICRAFLQRVIATGEKQSGVEYRVQHKNGKLRWYTSNGSPIRDAEGKIVSYIGIARDITERVQSYEKLQKTLTGTINAISAISEIRDPYTSGHQKKVAKLAAAISRKLKMDEEKVNAISTAALIHDIGKISIPISILSKPTTLTDIEFAMIKTHSQLGFDITKEIDFLGNLLSDIILQHHERLDGSGYPNGLKDEDILFEAKIVAVADVVEAMASHRPYRPSLGIDQALKEIEKNKGKLYDPGVVDACIKLFRKDKFEF